MTKDELDLLQHFQHRESVSIDPAGAINGAGFTMSRKELWGRVGVYSRAMGYDAQKVWDTIRKFQIQEGTR